MSEMKIDINKCNLVITNEAYDKINQLANSLPNIKGDMDCFSVDDDTFFGFHYDQKTNSIKISKGRGIDTFSCIGNIIDYAEIGFLFNGYHVLEFVFKYNQSITLKHDGYYYYNDDDKFFEMMNFILGYKAFRIKKEVVSLERY